jgi:hypothetical protein
MALCLYLAYEVCISIYIERERRQVCAEEGQVRKEEKEDSFKLSFREFI